MSKLTEKELQLIKAHPRKKSDLEWEWAWKFFGEDTFKACIKKDVWDNNRMYIPRADAMQYQCGAVICSLTWATKTDLAMAWLSNRRYVVMTGNYTQRMQVKKCIKEFGFEVIKDWAINPNTGHKIIFLMLTFPNDKELRAMKKQEEMAKVEPAPKGKKPNKNKQLEVSV